MTSESLTINDFEIFKEALTEQNLELQVILIQKIDLLAEALGEKFTREELLPFLRYHYVEIHDEILLNLAEQLSKFIPLVGGLQHSEIIFELLQRLCVTDENLVREKATESLISIFEHLTNEETERYLLPVINYLIQDDWFTSKCSAVMLFPSIYNKLSDERKVELRNSFKALIQDDSPMVRKAASSACVALVLVVEEDVLEKEFLPIFQDIAQDPMDSVRCGTIEIALALLERSDNDTFQDSIFKTIESSSDDPSWRVKQRLAFNVATLQERIPSAKFRGRLLALFQKLARNFEPEVRVLIASNLFVYCKNLRTSYLFKSESENNFEAVFEQSIMPIIQGLAADECEDVRLSLSSSILPLSTLFGRDCFKRNIAPFLLQVLSKEASIVVQTNFLLGLSSLSDNADLDQSLEAIKNVIRIIIVRSHSSWRTRRSILTTFIHIAKFCDADYFQDNFKIYLAALLGDQVFAVRRSACLILPILSKHYGIKWASKHLVPFFTMFAKDLRYLYRFVSLFGMTEMIIPHLCIEPESLLGDWKNFIHKPDHKKTFIKVIKSCHLIQKELKQEKYNEILKVNAEQDYNSKVSDMNIYFENDFDQLKDQYSQTNVYSVEDRDLESEQWSYIQGILNLVYNKFLPIIEMLSKDPTENVRIRVVYNLKEISNFITRLSTEENEEWIQEAMKSLTQEENDIINEEIQLDFNSRPSKFEDFAESLDTRLVDNEEPDLSQSIVIENSKVPDDYDIMNEIKQENECSQNEQPATNSDEKTPEKSS
ncbi:hypothetical protein ABEB36_010402 [Hypothenemus hampei]|uniref:Phosphatase 2A Regulatory Subunit A helical domain-containing protein n=1 Tax=Hypothenemus hampei TaxID=57062 RepID=A0ABD1EK58_HYPHA